MAPLDLDRLERVRRYAAVPVAARSDEWVREFEGAFWAAPLTAFDPMEIETPSGHPFLRISSRDFQPGARVVRPASLVDRLIDAGRGLVLTDGQDLGAVWMNLGQVVSYRLYGRAFAESGAPLPASLRLAAGESIGLSPVHEAVFPHWARLNVRRHLQRSLGIAQPRAVWAILPGGYSGLVFDLEVERMGDEHRINQAFSSIRWLLPSRIPFFRLDPLAGAAEMGPF